LATVEFELAAPSEPQPGKLVTGRFATSDSVKAHDTFGNAAGEGEPKVILNSAWPKGSLIPATAYSAMIF
jgi:hypothetical protein